jgi:hypothetical protein
MGPIATLLILVWEPVPKFQAPGPPVQLSTGILAIGIQLTVGSALVGVLAWSSSLWQWWVAAAALMALVIVCFVGPIVRRPAAI